MIMLTRAYHHNPVQLISHKICFEKSRVDSAFYGREQNGQQQQSIQSLTH